MKNHQTIIQKLTQHGAKITPKINPQIDPKKRRTHGKQMTPKMRIFGPIRG